MAHRVGRARSGRPACATGLTSVVLGATSWLMALRGKRGGPNRSEGFGARAAAEPKPIRPGVISMRLTLEDCDRLNEVAALFSTMLPRLTLARIALRLGLGIIKEDPMILFRVGRGELPPGWPREVPTSASPVFVAPFGRLSPGSSSLSSLPPFESWADVLEVHCNECGEIIETRAEIREGYKPPPCPSCKRATPVYVSGIKNARRSEGATPASSHRAPKGEG